MQVDRNTMTVWVLEALQNLGGKGKVLEVCKNVWANHGEEIKSSGDMFFIWQYEIRWAADKLRKQGKILPFEPKSRSFWVLK